MSETDKLLPLIYSTIADIELWSAVLERLCLVSGASKGIIMLRDRQTAELVIPSNVWHDLTSPMLYGFSPEEIQSYITHYAQFDPWTEFEKLYHPNYPYALSEHVRLGALQKSTFWEWLSPQNISDTIVLEIGTSPPNWIGMNLFFPYEDRILKDKILTLLSKYQDSMREAWKIGQQTRALSQGMSRLKFFLDQQSVASIILESDGCITLMNNQAKSLLRKKDVPFSVQGRKFNLIGAKNNKNFFLMLKKMAKGGGTTSLALDGYQLKLNLIEGQVEDMVGVDVAARLLTIRSASDKEHSMNAPIWQHVALTKRERQLIEILANGGRVVDFINKYALAKSTGHLHWANAKSKLRVTKISEVYSIHQIYLKNL